VASIKAVAACCMPAVRDATLAEMHPESQQDNKMAKGQFSGLGNPTSPSLPLS